MSPDEVGATGGSAPAAKPFGKVDIVHILAERYGYRRYLEIATGTTGQTYGWLDRGSFTACRRLLYGVPSDFDDGLGIDYRTESRDIAVLLREIAAERPRFDVMLVDPFHEYAESFRDIAAAFDLLAPGGAIVVHDCRPPAKKMVSPTFTTGLWCGVTYKAFLDFVLGRRDLRHFTVDADFGCGVILKVAPPIGARIRRMFDADERRRVAAWRAIGGDYDAAWRFFKANQQALLRLVSVEAFKAGAGS